MIILFLCADVVTGRPCRGSGTGQLLCSALPRHRFAGSRVLLLPGESGQCPVTMANVRWGWPVSGNSGQCPVTVASVRWEWPVSGGSGQCLVTVASVRWEWPVSGGSGQCTVGVASV